MEATPFELSRRETLIVVAGLMVGLSLAALDGTIVATALPTIVGDLGGLGQLSWVVTSYLLASTAATPLFGRLSDLYGRRRLFQVAIVIFIVGSMLAGFSQTMLQLILARGVQGVGGGGVMAMCFAIIGDVIPARERGRYMGFFTATFAAASVAGPLLGGFFVDNLTWRWIFYINLPLGLVALVVTSSVLRRVPFQRQEHRVDFLGAALMVAAVTSTMLVAVWGGAEYAWGSPMIIGLAAAAVILTVAFVFRERRVEEPILPLRLFRNPIAAVCFVISFLLGAVMFAATSFLPLFLQIVTGASATNSGLLIVPLMGGLTISSIITGRRITTTGRYRVYPIIGTALCTIGVVLLSRMGTDTTRLYSSVSMTIVGYGVGMTMPDAVTGRAERGQRARPGCRHVDHGVLPVARWGVGCRAVRRRAHRANQRGARPSSARRDADRSRDAAQQPSQHPRAALRSGATGHQRHRRRCHGGVRRGDTGRRTRLRVRLVPS